MVKMAYIDYGDVESVFYAYFCTFSFSLRQRINCTIVEALTKGHRLILEKLINYFQTTDYYRVDRETTLHTLMQRPH